MELFVTLDDQMKKVEDFKKAMDSGRGSEFLKKGISSLKESVKKIEQSHLNGKAITNYPEYSSTHSTFLKLFGSLLDPLEIAELFGFRKELLKNLIQKVDEGHKFTENEKGDLKKMIGISEDEISEVVSNKSAKPILNLFSQKMEADPNLSEKLSELLHHPVRETNVILNSLKELNQLINERSKTKGIVRKKIDEKLYMEAFEIYLKILKRAYARIHKINVKKIDNKDLYKYFRKEAPVLLTFVDNKLRNDFAHLNHDVRYNFSEKERNDFRNTLIVKIIASISAQTQAFTNFFRNSTQSIEKNFVI